MMVTWEFKHTSELNEKNENSKKDKSTRDTEKR